MVLANFTVLQGVVLALLLLVLVGLGFLAVTFSNNDQQLAVLAVLGILAATGGVFTLYSAAVLEVGPYTIEDYKDMLGFGVDADDETTTNPTTTTGG